MIAIVWVVFLVGQAVHLAVQVWAIIKAPNGSVSSWGGAFSARWPAFLARAFICTMVFWLWLEGDLISSLDAVNVPIPNWTRVILSLHVNAPIAGLAGYVADSLLAFIPWLKSSIPSV